MLTYDGIYSSFSEVPGRTQYSTDGYLANLHAHCFRIASEMVAGGAIPQNPRNAYNNLLAVTAALCSAPRPVIFDIGGGFGQTYLLVNYALSKQIDYHVTDAPEAMDWFEGRNFYPELGLTNIAFHRRFQDMPLAPDIAFLSSTLLYIDDYDAVLRWLGERRPEYILITHNLVTLNAATFVTAQLNVPPNVIPCRVFNAEHLERLVEALGYTVVLRSADANDDVSPLANFPPEYQENRTAHFLFRRR